MILFLLRDRNPSGGFWRRTLDGSTVPLAITVAGVWLSNGRRAYGQLSAGCARYLRRSAGKDMGTLVRAAVGCTLGLGLAGDFLVPAAWEGRWPISIPRLRFTITRSSTVGSSPHADPGLRLHEHDEHLLMASWVGISMIAVTLLGILIAWRRGVLPGPRRWWIPLALVPFTVLFFLPPFRSRYGTCYPAQVFAVSWRWLLVLERRWPSSLRRRSGLCAPQAHSRARGMLHRLSRLSASQASTCSPIVEPTRKWLSRRKR